MEEKASQVFKVRPLVRRSMYFPDEGSCSKCREAFSAIFGQLYISTQELLFCESYLHWTPMLQNGFNVHTCIEYNLIILYIYSQIMKLNTFII